MIEFEKGSDLKLALEILSRLGLSC